MFYNNKFYENGENFYFYDFTNVYNIEILQKYGENYRNTETREYRVL